VTTALRNILLSLLIACSVPLFGGELIDARGKKVEVLAPPVRIASSSLASDEILIELLKETNGLKRLVAVSTLSDNPTYSNVTPVPKIIKKRIGKEIESIVMLKPDLIILAKYNRPEMLSILDKSKLRTFTLGAFDSLKDISANIVKLGKLIHAEKAAKKLKTSFERELNAIRSNRPKKSPLILSFFYGGTVAGKNTTFDSLVDVVGGKNIAAILGITGWQKLSNEVIATLKPDYIVTPGEETNRSTILRTIRQMPGWAGLNAVKTGKVVIIPERELNSLSHHVVKAAIKLAKQLK